MAVSINTVNNPGNFPYQFEPLPVGAPGIKVWAGSVLGEASYTTGGTTVTPATFGMTSIFAILPSMASNTDTVVNNAGKLKFIVTATGAEEASTTNLSAVSVEVIIIGI